MFAGKRIFLVFLNVVYVCSYDFCSDLVRPNECSSYRGSTFNKNECSQVSFSGYKQHKNVLGDIKLTANTMSPNNFSINITFIDVSWKKAYLKLSENDVDNIIICKMYSRTNKVCVPNKSVFSDSCFNPERYELKDYLLEYKVETDKTVAYRKMLFKPLLNSNFDDVQNIDIFSYTDTTNSFEIILHLQALPEHMNISFYKVEVFREKSDKDDMLDIRLIETDGQDQYTFNFITYNDEGYYYFKISVISEECPEDFCKKTVTPKIHISRKGAPLVIGIVGASFIIPFVLFVFHIMSRRYQNQEEILESKDKILVIFKAHPEGHKDVIHALGNLVENLTSTEVLLEPVNLIRNKQKEPEKWCSDNLLLATHIFYVCGTDNFEMDYMTYRFLLEETRKTVQEKDIFVLKFPYSTKDYPSFLSKCVIFDLPNDTNKLLNTFQNDLQTNFENNTEYSDFCHKVQKMQTNMVTVRIPLNMPTIIITDQSDNDTSSDGNVRDSLL